MNLGFFLSLIVICFVTMMSIIAIILGIKFDWTKNKELLLWYWDFDTKGIKTRKSHILFKIN